MQLDDILSLDSREQGSRFRFGITSPAETKQMQKPSMISQWLEHKFENKHTSHNVNDNRTVSYQTKLAANETITSL